MNKSILFLAFALAACTYYENEPISVPKPKVPKATTTLEATYVSTRPNKVTSAYWKTADYLPVAAINIATGQVPPDDGLYNVSGTYGGIPDFNKGKNPAITLKAAYDDDSLYVLISWKDTVYNAAKFNWVYNGPSDPHKAGSTTGWTSQRDEDAFVLSFDMTAGKRDVWNWSLALSEPMGFAIDNVSNSGTITNDGGTPSYVRNNAGANFRGGPQYDWNGTEQTLTRKLGGATILDPAWFLLNKKAFTGDPAAGETYFQAECALCHGTTGDGEGTTNPTGIKLNKPGQFNRWTRDALDAFATNAGQHEGAVHYPASETDRANLFARLRGFSGIPGYSLQAPSGSSADIKALSNVIMAKFDEYNTKGYVVLLARKLNTGNSDDITFDPAQIYNFDFSVTNNDELNKIGLANQQLTFKPKN